MADLDKEFTGSIPEFYDTYLVPLIFEAYANDLAGRVVALAPSTVLEVAAGSGVVPRALAPRLGGSVRYLATDLNQPMLDHAASIQTDADAVEWRQADALNLPFDDGSFDTVICQFGVMFFPDRAKGYAEAYRVLKPEGTYIFNVWDRLSENEFASTASEAARQIFPDDAPQFLPRTPYGYYEADRICEELKQNGFRDVSVDVLRETSRAPSPRHPAIAYCQGTPLRNEIEARDPAQLSAVTDLAEKLISENFGTGEVESKMQALIVTARSG